MTARRLLPAWPLACLLLTLPPDAQARGLREIGLWIGESFGSNADFERIELMVGWQLPWRWERPSGWIIESRLIGSLGTLRGEGDSGALASLGLAAVLASPSGRWQLEGGVRPTLLEDDDYDGFAVGGNFHFTSHLGLSLMLGDGFGIGYRVSHLSNADLDTPNPGVDTQQVVLELRF